MDYKDWLRKDAFWLMPLSHDWVKVRRTLEHNVDAPVDQKPQVDLAAWTFTPCTPVDGRNPWRRDGSGPLQIAGELVCPENVTKIF
jgi:hypothetical protein